MNRAKVVPTRRTFLLTAALLVFPAKAVVSTQETPLFEDVDPGTVSGAGLPDDDAVLRTRFVEVNLDVIARSDGRSVKDVSPSLSLNLFDDIELQAVLDHIDINREGGYSWVGRVKGDSLSAVTLSSRNGVLSGNINTLSGTYAVRYKGAGLHIVQELDVSRLLPLVPPAPPDAVDESPSDPPSRAMGDDGSVIDVMVVYTPIARNSVNGAMETLIDMVVSETNLTYANSGVHQRLRLVHTAEVLYTETGDVYTDLDRLTQESDGYMDDVHLLRDAYGADEVVLILHIGQYCGLAWLMNQVSPSFHSRAFSVVLTSCMAGLYTFAHELGHTMAARHDWYTDDTSGYPFPYNHGHINFEESWRTIMSYNNPNCAQGYCQRIPYWSNPHLTYGGDPLGVPEGQLHPAENYRTLNNTAFIVANFRQSVWRPRRPIGLRIDRKHD